ncbi:MAG: glycosyltransferase family 4 protein [Thermoguttaceae bacterium]
MNIMEIVSGTRVNGAILHCLLLSRELARRGHAVTLVCLPGAWIGGQAAGNGIDVVRSDLHRWPTDELRRIAQLVRQRRIDVIHTHISRAHFFGILLRWFSGAPSVATAHSRHIQLHWMFNDRVIAVSEATRRYQRMHNFVRAGRIETIHNFIDYGRLAAVPPEARQRVRRSLGIGAEAPLLGIVGNVIPRKGLLYLVRALPEILAAAPTARLLVVGGEDRGGYAGRVRAAAQQCGASAAIIWTGHRSDIDELLAALDLYVLPSLEESLPLSVLEAMAAGLPVVAAAVGGIPECVVAGETGLLVPPAQSAPLAQAIVELLGNPERRRRFGEAGRRRVQERFTAESQAPSIEAAFARAIRGRVA